MKKILALILVCSLALCLLAGCTGNGQTETDTDTATETATVPATETDTETTTETDTGNGAETATATETATETATMDYFESTKIELVEPDTSLVPDMSIAGDGYDIYLLTEGKEWGYRYGCTYLYNPDGREIVAKENECSALRNSEDKEARAGAYFNCHTDITIPYEEIGGIYAVKSDGTKTAIIEDGKFVLPGTEALNEALR